MFSVDEIREKYLTYMQAKGHTVIESATLALDNDSTTLFTGSGMQPLVPYLMGESHPKGKRLANSQKCFRAEDIEEIGDNRHTTFFEMLGNWSLGDYFKTEQIKWLYHFLIKELGLDPERIFVTVFGGDKSVGIGKDTDAEALWQEIFTAAKVSSGVAEIGSEADGYKRGIKPGERIFYYGSDKNWWSRVGAPANMPVGEIGGPDSEVFFDFGTPHNTDFGEHCHPNCDCGRFMEIGNSVFIEYIKTETGFERLPKKNVDFGGGLERVAAAVQNQSDMFKIDLLGRIIAKIEHYSGTSYEDNQRAFRIIADHIRGAVFMIGDGILPTNTEQGYFVRRLLRRAVRYADLIGVEPGNLASLAGVVIGLFSVAYPNLTERSTIVKDTIKTEEEQFRKTLAKGLREFDKRAGAGTVTGTDAFTLFTTYGFPYELTEELAAEHNIVIDRPEFDRLMLDHKKVSRAGAEKKFKGGLADNSEKVVQYHTATHLLLAALRHHLGTHIHQAGSNITGERLRFDFTHTEKVSPETLAKVEVWVNDAIKKGGQVKFETMSKVDAQNDETIEASFWERYPDEVKVYNMIAPDGTVYSRELCGGPHINDFSEIAGFFKIVKEESSSAKARRIKAVFK